MKCICAALALCLIWSSNCIAQLPFDSVIVQVKNYRCHYYSADGYGGTSIYNEIEGTITRTSGFNFSFDTAWVVADTVIYYNKSNPYQTLQIILDTSALNIQYFNFLQSYNHPESPRSLHYSFKNVPILNFADSMVGSANGDAVLSSGLIVWDHTEIYNGNYARWEYYDYLKGTTSDSTEIRVKLLRASHYPSSVINNETPEKRVLWPNPTNDKIFLGSMPHAGEVRIYDLLGRIVLRGTQPTIDVSTLPSGLYRLLANQKMYSFIRK